MKYNTELQILIQKVGYLFVESVGKIFLRLKDINMEAQEKKTAEVDDNNWFKTITEELLLKGY